MLAKTEHAKPAATGMNFLTLSHSSALLSTQPMADISCTMKAVKPSWHSSRKVGDSSCTMATLLTTSMVPATRRAGCSARRGRSNAPGLPRARPHQSRGRSRGRRRRPIPPCPQVPPRHRPAWPWLAAPARPSRAGVPKRGVRALAEVDRHRSEDMRCKARRAWLKRRTLAGCHRGELYTRGRGGREGREGVLGERQQSCCSIFNPLGGAAAGAKN
jgi:hypothetical protein